MTVETQVLRALARGRALSLPDVMRVGLCSKGRAGRAVRVLVALGLLRRAQLGARRAVYFSV